MARYGRNPDGSVSVCKAKPGNEGKYGCMHSEHVDLEQGEANAINEQVNQEKYGADAATMKKNAGSGTGSGGSDDGNSSNGSDNGDEFLRVDEAQLDELSELAKKLEQRGVNGIESYDSAVEERKEAKRNYGALNNEEKRTERVKKELEQQMHRLESGHLGYGDREEYDNARRALEEMPSKSYVYYDKEGEYDTVDRLNGMREHGYASDVPLSEFVRSWSYADKMHADDVMIDGDYQIEKYEYRGKPRVRITTSDGRKYTLPENVVRVPQSFMDNYKAQRKQYEDVIKKYDSTVIPVEQWDEEDRKKYEELDAKYQDVKKNWEEASQKLRKAHRAMGWSLYLRERDDAEFMVRQAQWATRTTDFIRSGKLNGMKPVDTSDHDQQRELLKELSDKTGTGYWHGNPTAIGGAGYDVMATNGNGIYVIRSHSDPDYMYSDDARYYNAGDTVSIQVIDANTGQMTDSMSYGKISGNSGEQFRLLGGNGYNTKSIHDESSNYNNVQAALHASVNEYIRSMRAQLTKRTR